MARNMTPNRPTNEVMSSVMLATSVDGVAIIVPEEKPYTIVMASRGPIVVARVQTKNSTLDRRRLLVATLKGPIRSATKQGTKRPRMLAALSRGRRYSSGKLPESRPVELRPRFDVVVEAEEAEIRHELAEDVQCESRLAQCRILDEGFRTFGHAAWWRTLADQDVADEEGKNGDKSQDA